MFVMRFVRHRYENIPVGAVRILAWMLVGFAITSFSPPQTSQQTVPTPTYTVQRTRGVVTIDGVLNEESWLKAVSTGNFVLTDSLGKPQSSTSAKALWDSLNLYIAFECADSDIIGRMNRRDDKLWEEEVIEVFFAPASPEKFGYTEIEISPANTVLDLYVREVRGSMPVALPYNTYTLNIRSATQIRGTINNSADKDTSWTVEMALPLADIQPINLPPIADGDKWRMNLYRIDRFPTKELSAWSPTMVNRFHVPSRFGEIVFSMKRVGE
jgi:hypothetical protein